MKHLFYLALIVLIYSCTSTEEPKVNNEFAQWRGDNRDGVYNETGLLKKWDKEGPKMLWFSDSVGNGYGSPSVTNNKLFICGAIDSTGVLFVFDLQGKMLWKAEYGKEWGRYYPGSRCSPTVIGDMVYVCSGFGDIVCFESETGKKIWSKNMTNDFNGRNLYFGYSESLLVDDSLIFATVGGKDTSIVALNRFDGKPVWISKANGELSAYCSPMMIKLPKRKIVVTFTDSNLIGVDAKDGSLLWSHKQDTFCTIHANTPLYENGFIYYVAGCGNSAVKLKLADDGSSITEVWRSKDMDNYMGGFIKVNDKFFGASERNRNWRRLNANTGELIDSLKFNKGVTIFADNMLYLYNEKGEMGLLNPSIDSFKIESSFKIKKGTYEHFSHPVIKNGVLYIRHGKSLMAYDIKEKK
jgi:outer membrane protein assembly factor BamB